LYSLSLHDALPFSRPSARGFVCAILGMIVAAATEPLFPALMKPLLDDGFVNGTGLPLWAVPTALIAIFVVRGIATFTSSYAMAWVANKVLVDLRRQMFSRSEERRVGAGSQSRV